MNYFGYDLQLKAAYSRPTFTTRTSLMYNMSDKFIIRGDIYTFNKRTSIEMPSNKEVSLKPITDINLHIDYRYNKNVGLFLNFNNLTNNRYERWYNYQMYGFNVLAGLSVTF
jgi:outer membrane receptor protein involved in Fe transport